MIGPNEAYDAIRCRTCGCPWICHPESCCRHPYRPAPDPEPVDRARRRRHAWEVRHGAHAPAVPAAGTASNLPQCDSDETKARREVAGAAPTREWTGRAERARKLVDAMNRDAPSGRVLNGALQAAIIAEGNRKGEEPAS